MPLIGQKFRSRVAIMDLEETQFLEFDALISATYSGTAVLTDHPVEGSIDITDHIRRQPKQVQIKIVVSNSPIIVLASLRATPSVPGTDPATRAEAAFLFLEDIKDNGKLVHLSTNLFDYTNMAISSLSVTRDKDTSHVLEADITLREIQIAAAETTTPPVPADSTKTKKKNLGNKAKQPAPEPARQSALTKLFGIFGG
jgi:hypothetical protein